MECRLLPFGEGSSSRWICQPRQTGNELAVTASPDTISQCIDLAGVDDNRRIKRSSPNDIGSHELPAMLLRLLV